jgi:very-short-patch-repair endonuclease
MTYPERRLWSVLRRQSLAELKFVKQVPIGPYIVDFVCREKRLLVEVDGDSHADRKAYDERRAKWLVEQSYQLIRVTNDDVLQNLEGVLATIVAAAGIDVDRWRSGEFGKVPEVD